MRDVAVTYLKRGRCAACGKDARRRQTFDVVDGSIPAEAIEWIESAPIAHVRCEVVTSVTPSRLEGDAELPSPDALLGADPSWTGGESVDDYMDRQRRA